MNNRFVRVLLLFAALWLPVQTMAAMAAPLCRHAQEQAVGLDSAGSADAAVHCHETPAPDPAAHDAGCDKCEICHLACAGFMPSTPLATALVPAGNDYASPATAARPSHIAEPPQHPPRSST